MSYIDTLLKTRNLREITPLWKFHLSEEEIADLVNYLNSTLNRLNIDFYSKPGQEKFYGEFVREACLLYSYWWNKVYAGGKASWDRPLNHFHIDSRYQDIIKNAVIHELECKDYMNIRVYRTTTNRRMFFQSILAQGGLPMNIDKDSLTQFENYLVYLIEEYKQIDSRDWSNITIAQSLAERYITNQTLKDSEAVLNFALEIVRAYFDEDNTLFVDYTEVQELLKRIRTKIGKHPHEEKKFFKVSWEFKRGINDLKLYYKIIVPSILELKFNESLISYYVNGTLVGSYHKQGEKYVLMPGTSSNAKCLWDAHTGQLTLIRKQNCNLNVDTTLVNSVPPFLEEPFLLQFKAGYWVPKQRNNDESYVCLIPEGWVCQEYQVTDFVKYDGHKYGWLEFRWNDLNERKLILQNEATQETVVLDNSVSEYNVSFSPRVSNLIEESSELVAINCQDLRKLFTCFNNDSLCSNDKFKFYVKSFPDKEFVRYTGQSLPCGPVRMKVSYPDSFGNRTFSFYNLMGLSVEHLKDNILSVSCSQGNIALKNGQDNIQKLPQEGEYQVLSNQDLTDFAPIKFRFYPKKSPEYSIDLGVETPLKRSCFIDSHGHIIKRNTRISIYELGKLKINLCRTSTIKISYFEKENQEDKCLITKKVVLKEGRYPLDILKEDLDRLIFMNGFNDYHRIIQIEIKNSNAQIYIKNNAYSAKQGVNEQGAPGVWITRGDVPIPELEIHAVAINAPKESPLYQNEDILMSDSSEQPGFYTLPEIEDPDIHEFILFTDNNLDNGHLQPFFFDLKKEMDMESRDLNKRNSIWVLKDLLQRGDEKTWNEILKFYFPLAIRYGLSYSHSFNCFVALSNDPSLLAEFLIRLKKVKSDFDNNTILDELQRMERELSFRFHYLPKECWINQVNQLKIEHNSFSPEIVNLLGDELTYTDSKFYYLKELIKCQFGEEGMMAIYFALIGEKIPGIYTFEDINRYYEKVNDALADFDYIWAPDYISFPVIELKPKHPINHFRNYQILQKLQCLSLILPQCAAQYVHGVDMKLWEYLPQDSDENRNINARRQFIKRMINYMSIYASEAYNELFKIALFHQPVKQ